MLTVLSPAKSLDLESPIPVKRHSVPEFATQAEELVDVLRGHSPQDLSRLMSISESLGELNHERFVDFELPLTTANARPAVLTFAGDVYRGMQAASWSGWDFNFAQKTVRILSGLFGVLRPLDLIAPYRLEMGTRLAGPWGANLYEYWDDQIAKSVSASIADSPGTAALVNLASVEYFSAIDETHIDWPVVTPRFLDAKGDGEHKVVSFFAKYARGAMASWMVQNRVKSIKALTGFDGLGYRYDEATSTKLEPVFKRRNDAYPPT